MIVRALDSNLDWTYGRGKNDYLSQNAAISQNIGTRLRSFLGDCFFKINAGIDWFNLLGAKDLTTLELNIRSMIINTDGVLGLVSLSLALDALRQMRVSYAVTTVYTGIVNTQGVVSSGDFILTEDGSIITTEDGNPITT